MNESQILLFIITSLLIIITPGQDMMLVMSKGVAQGSRAGLVTALGVSTGLIGHTLFAAFGLGTLLMASDLVFTLIKYIGAAYLIYLGWQLIVSGSKELNLKKGKKAPLLRLFLTGIIANISNPKITIFYFAYLPQFLPSDINEPTYMLLMLGIGFSMMTFMVKGPVGYLAGRFSQWMRPPLLKWMNRTSGTVLICLGIKLAFEKR